MIEIEFEWYQLLNLLASTVFPLLVGLVTTRTTDPGRKATFLALLSVLTPLAAEMAHALATGVPYDLVTALFVALANFLIAVGLHYGFWKPKGISQAAQDALVKTTG